MRDFVFEFDELCEFLQEHPRRLIPELCKQMYDLGWVTGTGLGFFNENLLLFLTGTEFFFDLTGTGGGISIKLDDEIYIAPSGVQKERINIDDIFIQNMEGDDLAVPPEYKKLKKSQCTPLFMVAYRERKAGACIHTHSPNAVMATLLWPGKEFRITHQEMIKV